MNSYTLDFSTRCPVNGARIRYTLRIETPAALMLPAEQLIATVEELESGAPLFHEEIADRLAAAFPGKHTMRAHHHGVDIETTRTGSALGALSQQTLTDQGGSNV